MSLDLDSIKSLDKIEILMINDGSSDKTEEIIKKWKDKYPNTIKTINKENGQYGSSINYGIKNMKSNFLKLLDVDDCLNSEYLDEYILTLEKNADKDIIINNYRTYNQKTQEYKIYNFKKDFYYQEEEKWDNLFINKQILTHHSMTFSVSLVKKIQSVPEKLFSVDTLFVYKALIHSDNIKYIDDDSFLYTYVIGQPNQSVEIKSMLKFIDHQQEILKTIYEQDINNITQENKIKTLVKYVRYMIYWRLLLISKSDYKIKEKKELIDKEYETIKANYSSVIYNKYLNKGLLKHFKLSRTYTIFIFKISIRLAKLGFIKNKVIF
jgi:glycosyltransferase involved in cell wall biosynthesis